MKSIFPRCQSGTSAIEFAILLPVMLVLFIGIVEVSRFIIINQKADKMSNIMADMITRGNPDCVRVLDLDLFAEGVENVMRPFRSAGISTLIFTGISSARRQQYPCYDGDESCIGWQHKPPGQGNDTSRIGTPGETTPRLPGDYQLEPDDSIIFVEFFYDYTPMLDIAPNFLRAFIPQKIYKVAAAKPRLGGMTGLCVT